MKAGTTRTERALLVLAIAGLAAAVTQTVLLARLLVRVTRPAAPAPAPGRAWNRPRQPGIGEVSAVPQQDPHAPPSGPLRITHAPPPSGQPPEPAAVAG